MIFNLCNAQGNCNLVLLFFPVNNIDHRTHRTSGLMSSGTLLHNVFSFLSVPGQFSLEVTNVRGTFELSDGIFVLGVVFFLLT